MKLAVIYARFSSDMQREESIDAQLRACNEYAERNGYSVIDEYVDRAKSATTDQRPQFQKMIGDAKKQKFQYVIIHKLDRFSRDRYDHAFYKRELRMAGVTLLSVLEHIDSSPESVIMESVLEGFSEYYSRNLSREVMKGMKENALACRHTGGVPPLGYDVGPDGKYIINEKEAEVVRFIFTKYLEGNGSFRIAKLLKEKGYTSKGGCKNWPVSTIITILKNEKYKGDLLLGKSFTSDPINKKKIINNGEEDKYYISNHHEPIISAETFDRAQQIMNENSSTFKKSEITKYINPDSFMFHKRWEEKERFGDQLIMETKNGIKLCPDATKDNMCYVTFSLKLGPKALVSFYNGDVLVTQDAHMNSNSSLNKDSYEWKHQRGYYIDQPFDKIVIEFVADMTFEKVFNSSNNLTNLNITYSYQDDIKALVNQILTDGNIINVVMKPEDKQ